MKTKIVKRIEVVVLSPPPAILTCTKAPPVPEEMTGQSVGEYILMLNDAYKDCSEMLQQINAWVESAKSEAE